MSVKILREAAALMRERAEAATVHTDATTSRPLPWISGGMAHAVFDLAGENIIRQARVAATPHIASWHPAVALAVADWLDTEADRFSEHMERQADPERRANGVWLNATTARHEHALAVARAYLGEQP